MIEKKVLLFANTAVGKSLCLTIASIYVNTSIRSNMHALTSVAGVAVLYSGSTSNDQ